MNPIRADGGGDTAEDIMGGLKMVFTRLSWRPDATKVYRSVSWGGGGGGGEGGGRFQTN